MSYGTEPVSTRPGTRSSASKGANVKLFLVIWIVFIGLGVGATYMYSQHLKQTMLSELDAKWRIQSNQFKSDYSAQMNSLSKEVKELDGKVQSFNELLTFTKDNASNKTDNSNKLYTQLNEVKKQLSLLQNKMDLLK
ncbi:hypothetical protein J2Z69_003259 [Paenibacillus shirakamiensis]|uniref:Uncharacterized protein n=1 Tax=Paenibacillus shirakamiensis TaxID=1265935 RepID=A0ABS4JKH2_9BACL|nr:hypothetical protein [Paenibacillus shirakamiensis]MBP2002202.1 hypothetical protein [Paenibacillus shirakamiensis]